MAQPERDIRSALQSRLKVIHAKEPDSIVLDELGLCQGVARVDIAVVNGLLHGYEIKTENDTLERLPRQEAIYSRTLDTVTIVAGKKHLRAIEGMIPQWWSILEIKRTGRKIQFSKIREGFRNPSVDPFSLAQLLWRDEALDVLQRLGLITGLKNKPRYQLWQKLIEVLSLEELSEQVRRALKRRENWRSGSRQTQDDAWFLPSVA